MAEFPDSPIEERKRETKYARCRIGKEIYKIGDCVKVREEDSASTFVTSMSTSIVKITSFTVDSQGDQYLHAELFVRSRETILGQGDCDNGRRSKEKKKKTTKDSKGDSTEDKSTSDASLKNELFLTDFCDTFPMEDLLSKFVLVNDL